MPFAAVIGHSVWSLPKTSGVLAKNTSTLRGGQRHDVLLARAPYRFDLCLIDQQVTRLYYMTAQRLSRDPAALLRRTSTHFGAPF